MTDQKTQKTPYVPWSTYINFMTSLTEYPLPDHIDRSVVSHLSGSVQSILLIALRSTGMILDHGVPSDRLRHYIAASESERKRVLLDGLKDAFPFFFDGGIDLVKTSPQKFDERLRELGGLSGSTLDKGANFFLAAAEHIGIEVGAYLKKRKPSSKRPSRPRRQKESPSSIDSSEATLHSVQTSDGEISEKALEYRLVDLMSDASDNDEVLTAIWTIVRFLKAKNAVSNNQSGNHDGDEDRY